MNYVAYDKQTGKIFYFYGSTGPVYSAPDGLGLLQVSSELNSNCIDTHKVVNQNLVLIE